MKNNLEYNNDILALYKSKFEKPKSAIREMGLKSIQKSGLPGYKHEEWKYTNPEFLIKKDYFFTSSKNLLSVDLEIIKKYTSSKIVNTIMFHDGVFLPEISKVDEAGLTLEVPASEKSETDFGSFMNTGNESFLALNALLHASDLQLKFSGRKKHLLEIIHIISGKNGISNPRINLKLDTFSEVEIIEKVIDLSEGGVSSLYNIVTHAQVSAEAKLEIHKDQSHLKSTSRLVDSLVVKLFKNSSATVNTFCITAGITRNNIYGVLSEEGAYFDIKGLSLLDGKEHVDNRTIIEHDAPNCNSNQLYKGIFNGSSTGVFNGKIVVKPDAQKTNAFQSNKNLLLSNDAAIYSKPQLEIFADDVKCSHGATSSQPDEDALFYLKSRGISAQTAKAMLTYAFANEITGYIKNEDVKEFISYQIAKKLGLDWI